MSNFEKCISKINEAAGRKLTDDELETMVTELRARRQYLVAKGISSDVQSAALRAADEYANNIKMAAVILKRNAALDLVKKTERLDLARAKLGTKVAEALESILVGTNRARESVASIQQSIVKQYRKVLTTDLVQKDLHGFFSSGKLDLDVARAMWAIGRKDEAQVHAGIQKEAVEIAKIIDKVQDFAKAEANKEGAWIGKRLGYITRQTHDSFKIAKAKDRWMEVAKKELDLLESFGGHDVDQALAKVYTELASGSHVKVDDEAMTAAFKGPANVAKKVSQSRELIFKDADAWFRYNKEFGTGNLRETVLSGLDHSAKSTGMMRVLGTNPKANLQWIKERLIADAEKAGDVEQLDKLKKREGRLANEMAAVDGSMDIASSATLARNGQIVRGVQTMAKLGSMIFSQANDIVNYGSKMSIGQGRNFFSSMGEAVAGLGQSMTKPERFELLSSLDVVHDALVGDLGRTGSISDPGSISKMQMYFFKANLSQWWTNRLRGAAAQGMSHHMALQKGKAFDALHPDFQRTLGKYGITAQEWDKVRTLAKEGYDGREYITTDDARAMDTQVGQKIANYFTDRLDYVVLAPDAKTKALTLFGTQRGSWDGEFWRHVMQFKSWTGAYMQKGLGEELFGRGYEGDSIWGALRAGNGEIQGLARMITMSTLAGYASLTIGDMMKNKSPRDLSDPEIAYKTFLASMLKGGGLGIYGDFLFGEAARNGNSMLETLAGPTFATGASLFNMLHKIERGDMSLDSGAAQALRLGIQNTPFINLFYSKMALDYFILNDVYDSLSPGYMRRMERRLEKDNGQHFLVRPQ